MSEESQPRESMTEDSMPEKTPKTNSLTQAGGLPAGGLRSLTLPNGLKIACQTTTEAKFFYEDIFVKRIYHRHGISLDDLECVFDVGGNIGLFTLFIRRFCPRAMIHTFEPAPPLFEILRHNTADQGARVRLHHCALSDHQGEREFVFYPSSSGMSSLYADLEEEREALEAIMHNQLREGVEGVAEVLEHSEDLLEERLRSVSYRVELRTLSQVLRDEGVERVDLLKIDVQKSEADVIAGIEERDWPKIRQIVLEVHDIEGRREILGRELRERGFVVAEEQDEHYETSNIWNLFAIRPGVASGGEADGGPRGPRRVRDRAIRLRAAVQRQRGADGGKESNA